MSFTTETSTPFPDAFKHPQPSRSGQATPGNHPPGFFPRVTQLRYLNAVEHRPIEWLWQDRLAAGSLAVLSGGPGAGKTWVALAIAAALSKGRVPADTSGTASTQTPVGQPCTILYAAAQQLGAELIRPRFLSLGGDPHRLVLLRGVLSAADPLTLAPLSLYDTPMLEDALGRTRARLLILDPMHSYLAAGGRHRAHETARLFDNLAQLAESYRCCILLVRHLRRRGRGHAAIDLSGAARTEFLVGSSPDASESPALVQTKSNLGPLAVSLGYRIQSGHAPAAFSWTGPSNLTLEDLQTDKPVGAGLPHRKLAAQWLAQQLANGPLTQGTIETAAMRDGFALITIRRAKMDMGILSTRSTPTGIWSWELPQNSPETQAQPTSKPGAGKTQK